MKNKKKNRNKKRTVRSFAFLTIIIFIVIEVFAYIAFTIPGNPEGDGYNDPMLGSSKTDNGKLGLVERRRRKKKQVQDLAAAAAAASSSSSFQTSSKHVDQIHERMKTMKRLQMMGVIQEKMEDNNTNTKNDDNYNFELSELPPWSQVLHNWNSITKDDEPVIVGLDEYCEDFRQQHLYHGRPRQIRIGPAGMFSTGTNLIAALLRNNCAGPTDNPSKSFAIIQVPWGKHNPAEARTSRHQVKMPMVPNFDAVMPIVAIRHPYTWMSAMCKHSYNTRWRHNRGTCDRTLGLTSPILRVPYGYKNHTNAYPSLAHMWKYWYKEWFLDVKYKQQPRIMVRHEDIVYRPEKVIKPICECVGGTLQSPFLYEEESANKGKGHGHAGRSGLIDAVIKYGQPLHDWYMQYSNEDRTVLRSVLQGDQTYKTDHVQYDTTTTKTNNGTSTRTSISYTYTWNETTTTRVVEEDPEEEALMREIYETFQYTLFDDLHRPNGYTKHLNPVLNKKPSSNPAAEQQQQKAGGGAGATSKTFDSNPPKQQQQSRRRRQQQMTKKQ